MFDEIDSLFAQIVVDVYPFGVAGVCHSVVADADNIDDSGQVAVLQSGLEILGEGVDCLQGILFPRKRSDT